ncbi:hypothetical protein [Jeotgalibacillus soli]|uniref:Phosphoribosylanthranilate isomerase n=1 Tax=Jeotgalibacillus soli TaxID=889306 RepID=A0A0C2RNK4_9BACL|nr:hypothetical protein [Jeotgalibacillus soli]KIL51860.1 hypothetical protein KP78_02300 [Jeotgalibacillus soli]
MDRSQILHKEFIQIAKELNSKLNAIPVLYGSLGLQVTSGINYSPRDIDILVPKEFIEEKWTLLRQMMEGMGYIFVDLHEHEFNKNGIKAAFSFLEDLYDFAGVDYKALEIKSFNGAAYKQLSLHDYLKVYLQSSKDSYRKKKNNSKDLIKIDRIRRRIKKNE